MLITAALEVVATVLADNVAKDAGWDAMGGNVLWQSPPIVGP